MPPTTLCTLPRLVWTSYPLGAAMTSIISGMLSAFSRMLSKVMRVFT